MKNLLDEIYDILEPAVIIKGSSPQIIDRVENRFYKKLKDKEKKLFSDYEMAYSELCAIVAAENFKKGFKAGLCFIRELSEV
ncbi:MAG: hypothetical protein FWE74_00945 [Oscillospiraceae bacterium]|nr:hypothetical protein [Oscillospiraceae bacterium]